MAKLAAGAVYDEFPPACAAGYYGDSDETGQTTAECSGPCVPSFNLARARRGDGSVTFQLGVLLASIPFPAKPKP